MDFTLYNISRQALNWLIPKRCLQCDSTINERHVVCERCYPLLPFQHHCCKRCGQNYSANTDFCGHCLIKTPSFDRCFCPFKYESTIKELICDLKYRERPELAKSAAALLQAELLQHNIEMPSVLIPVPMHRSRLRERGYNQASLIAKHLGKSMNIQMLSGAVVKSKKTAPQAQQSLVGRKKNLKGSFKINKNFTFKSVAIIDDVVTTGTTAEEIAKILKKNGVDCVQVWGIAHTL